MQQDDAEIRKLRRLRALTSLYRGAPSPTPVKDHEALWDFAAQHVGAEAAITYLEFGVAHGKSMRRFSAHLRSADTELIGFDSFEGLPEHWDVEHHRIERGTFSTRGQPPAIDDERISFVKGWFQNTVPAFFREKRFKIGRPILIHFDVDLYSSNLFLFSSIWAHIDDYYFVMDDFIEDDMVALHDFTMAFPVRIRWLAHRAGPQDSPVSVFGHMSRIPFRLEGETA